jgi:hypothetical protein
MTKPFDWNDVDAALKRAAWKAVHGTREDKAGRFSPEPKGSVVKEAGPETFVAETKPKR